MEALQRRSAGQQDSYVDVDPQPQVMIVVIDEADPHANQKDSYAGQYGVLYVLRDDEVKDKDVFWYTDPHGQRFRWGVIGQARWNIDHALTKVDYGVKQFRIRRGG
ncbi:head-to-tail stopper [Mycobacterium phage Gattaca]|uniref:Head-to-tail stopper n=1 Tax=Mycobacterium phage Gattaca TaxID=1852567 RepID=A0A192Y912_9CAUD|nr:head-to-tail stopper [Mycobacterium phage Gattaca]